MPLTLSRKEGEGFTVDGPAAIRVVKTTGGRVVLEIDAPADTKILRNELDPMYHELGGEEG